MKNIILLLLTLSLSGCALFGEKSKKCEPEETIINTPLQVPGVMLSGNDRGKIRTSENIKSYYIGRHIDQRNPNLLHPAGVVLEVVDKPRWIMTPRGVDVPSGVPTRLAENKCSQALITEFRQDLELIKQSQKTLERSRKELESCRKELRNTISQVNSFIKNINNQKNLKNEMEHKIEIIEQKIAELENKFLFSTEKTGEDKK